MDILGTVGIILLLVGIPVALVLLLGKMKKNGYRNNDNSAPPDIYPQ